MPDCNIIVKEFKLQWFYYVHVQTNTLGKSTISFIPTPAKGEIIPLLSFNKDGFGIKYSMKVDMPLNKEIETKPFTTFIYIREKER